MNDPHVESLTYQVEPGSTIQFADPPAVEKEFPAFRLLLDNGVLLVSMVEHHATAESARARIEPYLAAWEIASGLNRGRQTLTFQFASSQVVDRNPPAGRVLHAEFGSYVLLGGDLSMTVGVRKYPEPPEEFLATDDVKVMWTRYRAYVEGKEPLLSMAYACLSLLEGTTGQKAGARAAVCVKYHIDPAVRKTLGDLVSRKGCSGEARKLDYEATKVPLSGPERDWIEQVIRSLIRRKAEYDYDPAAAFPTITMSDFPAI